MKTIFVLFDSLVRNALECYGGSAVATPPHAERQKCASVELLEDASCARVSLL
jgi:hypothetical protein